MDRFVMRKAGAYLGLFCVIWMMFLYQKAYAQALPAANFVVNRAVAGVITRVAASRGFAANDPRIAATLAGVSKVSTELNVAATVGGVALSIAGAPVWLTVAAGLGIIAAGTALYAYTNGSEMMFSMSLQNGKLSVNRPEIAGKPYVRPAATGIWKDYVEKGHAIYRTSSCISTNPCAALPMLPSPAPNYYYPAGDMAVGADTLSQMSSWHADANERDNQHVVSAQLYWVASADGNSYQLASHIQWVTDSGETLVGTSWANWVVVSPAVKPVSANSLSAVASQLNSTELASQIDEEALAKIVDRAWMRAASQPGYEGMPYNVAQPVTADDTIPWINANQNAVPTVGDLLAPASNPGAQVVPIGVNVSPGAQPDPGTETPPTTSPGTGNDVNVINTPNVNIVNTVKVDFGADPNVGSPNLEATPTASDVLGPLVNLFPEFRSFQTPQHVGECPKPVFDLFDQSFVMDSHCTIAEQNRAALAAIMTAVWMLVGLFILLSA